MGLGWVGADPGILQFPWCEHSSMAALSFQCGGVAALGRDGRERVQTGAHCRPAHPGAAVRAVHSSARARPTGQSWRLAGVRVL